ncbi:MAG: nuclear transport factor 2 family protein [bacterium]|nr:nuclear transport factor 2 family protein [bacterium]
MIWYLKKRGVSFLEKQVTCEEKEIAAALKRYFSILNTHDLDGLSDILAEDAEMHSYAAGNRMVGKDEFIKIVKKIFQGVRPIYMENTMIRIVGESAIVNTLYLLHSHGHAYGPQRTQFEFKKENGGWKLHTQLFLDQNVSGSTPSKQDVT